MNPSTNTAPKAPLPLLGLACAVGVSSIYFNQPLLLEMGHTFHKGAVTTGLVVFATQLGYAFGMLLFVPLGDVLERRSLMMKMYGAVSLALLCVAFAPSMTLLIAASTLVGVLASVTHIALPIAPDLVSDDQRGRAIGIVMTGLLLGILLARTFAGWVSKIHGWQNVYVIAALINLAFVPLLRWKMPLLPPRQNLHYSDAMKSLWTLIRTQPLLRESCIIGALAFASFNCLWTTLVYLLSSHYGLGAGVAGTFGLVGATGALVAPIAGRFADKRGPRFVLMGGIAILAISYILLWAGELAPTPTIFHIAALILGVIVLDAGAQMMQIANQTRIFGLDPAARSRLNTVYMVCYFSGGALGAGSATLVWDHFQWNGVCLLALAFIALAALRLVTGIRDAINPTTQTAPTADMVNV